MSRNDRENGFWSHLVKKCRQNVFRLVGIGAVGIGSLVSFRSTPPEPVAAPLAYTVDTRVSGRVQRKRRWAERRGSLDSNSSPKERSLSLRLHAFSFLISIGAYGSPNQISGVSIQSSVVEKLHGW